MRPCVFFRNDDVGVLDQTIVRLTELFTTFDAPASYGVIPQKVTREFVDYFLSLPRKDLFLIHQHGFAHIDYTDHGKFRGEFGTNRTREAKENDIVSGFEIIKKKFGNTVLKIFTPPWNTMDMDTYAILDTHGYRAFSIKKNTVSNIRNRLHDIMVHPYVLKKNGPMDMSVSIDLIKDWQTKTAKSSSELMEEFERVSKKESCVGIMLHDKVMNDQAFTSLKEFISELKNTDIPIVTMSSIIQ